MARPIEPIPTLKGKDALRFLKEKERVESLSPASKEYKERQKFFDKCIKVYQKFKAVE